MVCKTCTQTVSRVRIVRGIERCTYCGGFSAAGGSRTDGVLSRQRVRDQGVKYEGDTLNPWMYNKDEKAFTPNDEFVKLHGDKAHNFYKPDDLKAYPKLAQQLSKAFTSDDSVTSVGEYAPAIQEVITNA